MGYNVALFPEEIEKEFICPICSGVFEEPYYLSQCEHAFCKCCIIEWSVQHHTCPIDWLPISPGTLKPFPRILNNLLSDLLIMCDNASLGCTTIVKLEQLETHRRECRYNSKDVETCEGGCELLIPKENLNQHDCIEELTLRIVQIPAVVKSLEQDKLIKWANTLQRVSVSDWSGLISTPDSVLQNKIRRALILSACPPSLTAELVKNSHERKWPPGLKTFQKRQANRISVSNYILKKIPGKRAVAVMAIDNKHMNNDMVLEPGFVMIFSNGIE